MKDRKTPDIGRVCRKDLYAGSTVYEAPGIAMREAGEITGAAPEFPDAAKGSGRKKSCTKKLKLGARISFAKLVQANINLDYERSDGAPVAPDTPSRTDPVGAYAVTCCIGHDSIAKGMRGAWMTLAEWKYDEAGNAWIPVCLRTEQVDGTRIKENTFYRLIDGAFTEVDVQ